MQILINRVISDFDENFNECFCLPVKRVIILLLLLLHAFVAVITTPLHIAHTYLVLNKHPEGSGELSFGVLSSFTYRTYIVFKQKHPGFVTKINTDYSVCTIA